MPENILTDAAVRSAKPANRPYKLSDGGGLFLMVQPTGGKLWRWKYRIEGRENLFAIGRFPNVTLAAARAAREAARALIKQGIHPSHECRDHVFPLSTQAVEVLEEIRQISGKRYLFPHRSGTGFSTRNRRTYAMRDMNLGPRTSLHCWRTTFPHGPMRTAIAPMQLSGSSLT